MSPSPPPHPPHTHKPVGCRFTVSSIDTEIMLRTQAACETAAGSLSKGSTRISAGRPGSTRGLLVCTAARRAEASEGRGGGGMARREESGKGLGVVLGANGPRGVDGCSQPAPKAREGQTGHPSMCAGPVSLPPGGCCCTLPLHSNRCCSRSTPRRVGSHCKPCAARSVALMASAASRKVCPPDPTAAVLQPALPCSLERKKKHPLTHGDETSAGVGIGPCADASREGPRGALAHQPSDKPGARHSPHQRPARAVSARWWCAWG